MPPGMIDYRIDHFLRTWNHNPQIISDTVFPSGDVFAEIWRLDSHTATGVPVVSGCYPVGNTGRYAWSTEHLPAWEAELAQYWWRMSGGGTEDQGMFLIRCPESLHMFAAQGEQYIINH